MTSQYQKDKYNILKAIEQGCNDFDNIVWYTDLIPVRVRGFLRYFLVNNDINKHDKDPSQYKLTKKGYDKLNYWDKKYQLRKL